MSGLRERRHVETKQSIVDAAFMLFEKAGFAATAMDQIAETAGVSRSTLYRRFPTKEAIVLEVPAAWLREWDAAMDSRPDDDELGSAMDAGCLAVSASIDRSPERVLAAYRALAESPTLRLAGAANREWLERLAALVAEREPGLDRADAMAIAGAYMGAIDTMMMAWVESDGAGLVVDACRRLLSRLAPILP